MEDEIRKELARVKEQVQKKAGIVFNKETIALADLISEFVSVKVTKLKQENKLQLGRETSPEVSDALYQ